MAIENLFDVIRVTAGDASPVEAVITDTAGHEITEGDVHFIIDEAGIDATGIYNETAGVWSFTLPRSDLNGKYFYSIRMGSEILNFAAPIYFL